MLPRFIDAHVHLNTETPGILEFANDYGACLLSINTEVPSFPSLDEQSRIAGKYRTQWPDHIRYIASFSTAGWQEPDWCERVIEQIKRELDKGAVGIKVWKNIGMDPNLRYADGRFLMIDDPKLAPIFEFILERNLLLIAHLGEPRNCWLPLASMTVDSDREYFAEHPRYHMYLHPEFPSYEDQILARDRILDRYPGLRFVGLHLLSLEWNLEEVDRRLDRYPQLMTDLAERICHVQRQGMQHREAVREFFLKHQDRIIYGTDFIHDGSLPLAALRRRLLDLWEQHWQYFATDSFLEAPQFSGSFRGLALPDSVLKKIFLKNAAKTYGFSLPVQQSSIEKYS